ncbi:hypothetical protein [Pseudorhodobacter sp.]|nr:hypothetical protein [Pseudorhodobacter sp.]MDN5787872.1 hypothetical protein [Pseudorhodobacter sp.]
MPKFLALLCLFLAACGADGPPKYSDAKAPTHGVTLSGDARGGVVIK